MTKGLDTSDIWNLANELAGRLDIAPEDAMRRALRNELRRTEIGSLRERLQPLFDRIDSRPKGPDADKAFFDTLNGE